LDNRRLYKEAQQELAERKRIEEALRESEHKYRALFESTLDGLFVIDAETMKIVLANEAAAKMYGFDSVEDTVGANPLDFVSPEDRERIVKIVFEDMFQKDPRQVNEFRTMTKDGREIWISALGLRTEYQGRLAGLISLRDITKHKQMEDQFIITDRMASIGQLASGIAHEINNPLTGVIGFSQLLLERDVPDDIREDLGVIHEEAKRASAVVKNLLTFARKHPPIKQLTNVNGIIEKVLELRAYEQRANDIQVNKQLAPDLPEIIADYFQLQQVFLNIILNAEYFMIEAHRRGMLTITTEKVGGSVKISFADDGPGIPKENLGRLFDPFFTTKEVSKGTGLGLSVCHGIITEHGGKIFAESEWGQGATFVVELPIGVTADIGVAK
jgi:two-component system NtrC family sensor kinase